MAKVLFNANIQDIRGKVGNSVFTHGRSGAVLRQRVKGKNPKSTAQVTARGAFAHASTGWKNLTAPQLAAWANYATTIPHHAPLSGKVYTSAANAAYTGLAAKFLQVNAAGTPPTMPPTSTFAGDTITLTAAGGAGQVLFTASASNAANIKTELLLQFLKSKTRTPTAKGYRSKGFQAFALPSPPASVFISTGYYAAAYRFVNTLTGQETALVPIGVVQVM